MSSQAHQYGGDYVCPVLQTVELLYHRLVDGGVHVASPLVPVSDLNREQQQRHTNHPQPLFTVSIVIWQECCWIILCFSFNKFLLNINLCWKVGEEPPGDSSLRFQNKSLQSAPGEYLCHIEHAFKKKKIANSICKSHPPEPVLGGFGRLWLSQPTHKLTNRHTRTVPSNCGSRIAERYKKWQETFFAGLF